MTDQILNIKNLKANAGDKEILHDVNIEINRGEVHVIMGPNGAGKSTLAGVIMGNPAFEVTGGDMEFDGEKLNELSVSDRAKKGIFLSFQNPYEVPGITLENFIRSALENRTGQKVKAWDFHKEIKKVLNTLQMDESYAGRDLNVAFSGGEKKKAEILQMLMLKPSLAILDETDSGLDVDAVKTVSKGIEEFKKDKSASLLIITHNAAILDALDVDKVHILADGETVATGDKKLIDKVETDGFAAFKEA
ncbi:MAG: Fe-S cluster assembly ATPase SufC [Lachnospiraceae bacterium]|nr:Fe-S cluster assembly ATPase SufC [Lachnospiraceae bacterium]